MPAFFMYGFVVFLRAGTMPAVDDCFKESINADFHGQVYDVQRKTKSIALTIRNAGLLYVSGGRQNYCETGIIVYVDPAVAAGTQVGDVVEGNFDMQRPEQPSNPGQFDMRAWHRAQGISYTGYCENMRVTERPMTYGRLLYRFRQRLKKIYCSVLGEQEAGTVISMITGDREMLDDDIRDLYRNMGVIHILAISGLHISIVGRSLVRLLRKAGAGRRASALAGSFAVLSYYLFTGGSASCLRAVIMFLLSMGAVIFGRTYDMMTGLALSALISFTIYPLQLLQAGTQFSYGAVLGIAAVAPALRKALSARLPGESRYEFKEAHGRNKWKVWRRNKLRNLLDRFISSLAVSMMIFPISAYYYGKVPVIGMLLNVAVLPLASLLVAAGLAVGAAGLFSMPLAGFFAGSAKALCALLNGLCRIFYGRIETAVCTGSQLPWVIGLYYFLLAVLLRQLIIGSRRCSAALSVCLLILFVPFRRMHTITAFPDVGQGACIFLRTDQGTTWMIDGGSSTVDELARYRLVPFLTYYAEKDVDYAVVTHGDSDHYSGIRELLKEDMVRHLVISTASEQDEEIRQLAELAKQHGAEVMTVSAGTQWTDGTWQFRCLSPVNGETYEDKNDASIVLRLDTGRIRFLFPGDISSGTEKKLAAADLEDTDVLYVAHHGSKYASCSDFLEKCRPEAAVISCGRHNRYGHPAEETLERLQAADCVIYRTDWHGEAEVHASHGRITVEEYR